MASFLDERDLLCEAVDQRAAVAAVDHQLCVAKQRWAHRELAVVALGVDDPDGRRRDGDVVDIRACPGDASVVQHDDAGVQMFGEDRCDAPIPTLGDRRQQTGSLSSSSKRARASGSPRTSFGNASSNNDSTCSPANRNIPDLKNRPTRRQILA